LNKAVTHPSAAEKFTKKAERKGMITLADLRKLLFDTE
jgi:hypothetical protein